MNAWWTLFVSPTWKETIKSSPTSHGIGPLDVYLSSSSKSEYICNQGWMTTQMSPQGRVAICESWLSSLWLKTDTDWVCLPIAHVTQAWMWCLLRQKGPGPLDILCQSQNICLKCTYNNGTTWARPVVPKRFTVPYPFRHLISSCVPPPVEKNNSFSPFTLIPF